jgi:hypothetical protein
MNTCFPGSPAGGVVVLADLPIDDWRMTSFGADANNPAVAGDTADQDGDGLVNMLEYGLGIDPHALSPAGMTTASGPGPLYQLTYRRAIAATDVAFAVEWSADLADWNGAGVTEQVLASDGMTETVQASVSLPGASRCFMRLRVTRQ